MSLHQIIFTSCKKGIHGINDGLQIFSYDEHFKETNKAEIKSLFAYTPPALPHGVKITEDTVPTFPHAFLFQRLEKGEYAIGQSTYLEQDHKGASDRVGNHLSHIVLSTAREFQDYPCTFYGGPLLRSKMKMEEGNQTTTPAFLPTPVLQKGSRISIESVILFLQKENRLAIYKNMLHCFFSFEKEKKRLIILDSSENIVFWIAALEYALPLEIALNINFTTYAFDPALSPAQICGAVRHGTKFTTDSRKLHNVFDLEENSYPTLSEEEDFHDFMVRAFTDSFHILAHFHTFLCTGYSYRKADKDLYTAYNLYNILSHGFTNVTKHKLLSALAFADQYGNKEETLHLVQTLLSQSDSLLKADFELFQIILTYLRGSPSGITGELGQVLNHLLLEKFFYEFSQLKISQKEFQHFYQNINQLCLDGNFSIPQALMEPENQEKLFLLLDRDMRNWKLSFLIHTLTASIGSSGISVADLFEKHPIGQIYQGIIQIVFTKQGTNCTTLVNMILKEFTYDPSILTKAILQIEGILFKYPNGIQVTTSIWKNYFTFITDNPKVNLSHVAQELALHGKRKEIFILFSHALECANEGIKCRNIFFSFWEVMGVSGNQNQNDYSNIAISLYYQKLRHLDPPEVQECNMELFLFLREHEIEPPFISDLIHDLLEIISYTKPTREEKMIIENAFYYFVKVSNQQPSDKLTLLMVGVFASKISSCGEFLREISNLERYIIQKKVNLNIIPVPQLQAYFHWTFLPFFHKYPEVSKLQRFFQLFDMNQRVSEKLFLHSHDYFLVTQYKEKKNVAPIVIYIDFLRNQQDLSVKEDFSHFLSKLLKSELATLTKHLQNTCDENSDTLRYWNDVAPSIFTTELVRKIKNIIKNDKIFKA